MSPKKRWIIAGGIVSVALLTLVIEAYQIRRVVIGKPTAYQRLVASTTAISPTQDTDGDGIPDLTELTKTNTSPYLADTDGDGTGDLDELKRGTDPLCPEGKTCPSSTIAPGSIPPSRPPKQELTLFKELYKPNAISGGSLQQLPDTSSPSQEEVNALLSGSATPAQIRQFLIRSGMNAETVNGLNDDDLQRTYKETIDQLTKQQPSP